ncbi:Down syndrome cell adhesion molecule -like protein [Halotydeus destructor]|nr:Down syndrome cell adhesion molecule -like protein [Halotydeus destructor]
MAKNSSVSTFVNFASVPLLWSILLWSSLAARTFVSAVHVPAHFIEKFSVITVKQGDTGKITCDAFGSRPISVSWLKQNGAGDLTPLALDGSRATTSFSPSSRYYGQVSGRMLAFQKDYEDTEKRTVFELHILNTRLNDSSLYVCKVSNDYGEDSHNIELTVLDVPSAPEKLAIDGSWSRGVSLVWLTPRSNGNSPISQYVIQYWKEGRPAGTTNDQGGDQSGQTGGQQARLFEEVVSSSVSSHVLRDKLEPGTAYSMRIVGQNQFGRGTPSNTVRLVTKEEAPDGPPVDINVEPGSTVFRIKWKPPPRMHWKGQLKGYNIGYRSIGTDIEGEGEARGRDDDRDLVSLTNDPEELRRLYALKSVPFTDLAGDGQDYQSEFILTGLSKSATYSIIIQAYNSAGSGPFSQQIIASTSTNDPPAVPSLWVSGVTENSVKLKWDLKRNAPDVTHYILYYKDDKSPWLEIAFPVPEDNTYELINLEKGTWYQLYIRSVSKRGPSDPSEVLTIRTEGATLHGTITGGRSYAMDSSQQQVPPYIHSLVVIPVSVAIVIIAIACASAYAYVKMEERKTCIIKAGVAQIMSQSPSMNFQYISASNSSMPSRATSIVSEEGTLTLRYSDSSGRPLLARPPVPTVLWAQQQGPIVEESEPDSYSSSAYSAMPTLGRFTSFNPQSSITPASSSSSFEPFSPLKMSSANKMMPVNDYRTRPGSDGGLLTSFLSSRPGDATVAPASGNLFCKADIHSQDYTSTLMPDKVTASSSSSSNR